MKVTTVIAVILVGIPLNRFLGGTRSSLQRLAIAMYEVYPLTSRR